MSAEAGTPPPVQVDFALQVRGGELRASAVVPAERVTLVQLLPAVKQLTNDIVSATVSVVQQEGYVISCQAGCGACCRQLVPITLFEAEEFAAWIRSLPAEQQSVLEARFDAAISLLKKSGVLDRLAAGTMPAPGSADSVALGLDYFQAGVPCPFLQDESCGIHPIRPLICREYLVTSPAEFCGRPTKDTVRTVPVPVKLSRALVKLGAALTAEKRGWIPLTFLFAWMKSGVKLDPMYEGTGPELLRLVIDSISSSDGAPDPPPG